MKFILLAFLLSPVVCYSQVKLNLGLKAYYSFSGNAQDESGNNNHPVTNKATLTADRFGTPNSAYHFNGKTAYMKILNSASLNTSGKLSLSVWVKPMGFYEGKCHGNSILMKGDEDYLTGNYFLRFEDGPYTNYNNCYGSVDKLHQNFYGADAYSGAPGYKPYIRTNQWYHITVTYDGFTARLYIDCKLIASKQQKSASFTNKYDLYLGKLNNNSFPYWFNGDLDEVRIYNRALNQQEIQALCNETAPEKEPEIKRPEYVKAKIKDPKANAVAKQKPETKQSLPEAGNLPGLTNNNPITAIEITKQFGQFEEVKLEERKNDLVKEIVVDEDSIAVTLYDNGIVDGDSVTLIYNDVILTTHQLLSEKPVTFYIKVSPGNSRNELVMYAENLGSIPPNTALMVIYDGNKRYELNVSSTVKTNGVVSFKLRE